MIRSLILAILSFLLISGCGKKEEVAPTKTSPPPSQQLKEDVKEKTKEALRSHGEKSETLTVDMSSIEGRKLGGLYAEITGVSGTVGKRYEINYGEILANLWVRKISRSNVSQATVKAAEIPIQLYLKEPKKMTLRQFIAEANTQVSLVKAKMDWSAACKAYALTVAECKTFKALAFEVRGIDIVAYGMTEIMPSAEGDLNVKIMEILLRNAGSNYMFTIPALYDRMLSLGFYQFTSYAVNGGTAQGASKMNRFLPKEAKIPGSVIALRNGEHHRGAYLFALDNLANLAKRTNEKEFAALKQALKQKPGDIVTFMATAHHAPALALKSMKNWLSKGARGSLNAHLIGRLRPYGRKSDNNLAALEKFH